MIAFLLIVLALVLLFALSDWLSKKSEPQKLLGMGEPDPPQPPEPQPEQQQTTSDAPTTTSTNTETK